MKLTHGKKPDSKRDFLKLSAGAVAGAGLLASAPSHAFLPRPPAWSLKPAFVLVHGAWDGAWAFERLIPQLLARGHVAVARDLPGHGLNARFPASYGRRPLSGMVFGTEPSPLAGVTLEDYVASVIATIDQLRAAGAGRVVLVGHSLVGGATIQAVAERAPEKIGRLVYLAGSMPRTGVPAVAYFREVENQGELIGAQLLADPAQVGALRIDYRSEDAAYRAAGRQARYGDLSVADYDAIAGQLSCDEPIGPLSTPIVTTPSRWGSLPRHYIRTAADFAIRPALQQRFIAEADSFAPHNRTRVHSLNSAHTPQLSQPAALAALLVQIASD